MTFTLAALGGTVEVKTLTGKVALKIPAGTQSGTVFRLKGHGMPKLRGGANGDEYVKVHVEVPKTLTSEQRKALEEFIELIYLPISSEIKESGNRNFYKEFMNRTFSTLERNKKASEFSTVSA